MTNRPVLTREFEKLFHSCTLRIYSGGTVRGTAFFIAKNIAVTCAHVIKDLHASEIDVQWSDQKLKASIIDGVDFGNRDLALLSIKQLNGSHACVRISSNTCAGDYCYAFGYSDLRTDGDPVTLEIEGNLLSDVKLKGGQVRPGLSGSPILNLRTGYVCGVLRTTRDRAIDIGGIAVGLQDTEVLKRNKRSRVGASLWERRRNECLAGLDGTKGRPPTKKEQRIAEKGRRNSWRWWIYGLWGSRKETPIASVGYFRLFTLNKNTGIVSDGRVFRVDQATWRIIEARGQWASNPFLLEPERMTICYTLKRRHLENPDPLAPPPEHRSVMELTRQLKTPLVGDECWEGPFDDLGRHRRDVSGYILAERLPLEVMEPDSAYALVEENGGRFIQILQKSMST